MASGECWLTAASATTGTFCERATASVGQIAEAELGIAVADQPHGVGRAGALADLGDLDAVLGEVALLLADEEHGVVAAHHPVELDGDLVGGQGRPAGRAARRRKATSARA